MNAIIAEWVAKAEGDFNTARRELRARRSPNYDAVCFHAQQCAEKYLKAFLISRRIVPPRTHNLIELLKLSMTSDGSFEMVRPALELLNTYAIVVRYPRTFATKVEAADALKSARHVREFTRGKLVTK